MKGKYKKFKKSLPDNLAKTPEKEYAMRRYWRTSGKPKDFEESKKKEMFSKEDDGYYHAPSVDNKGKFLKPKTHPTVNKEIEWYKSDEGSEFRKDFELKEGRKYFKYKKKK